MYCMGFENTEHNMNQFYQIMYTLFNKNLQIVVNLPGKCIKAVFSEIMNIGCF